MKRSRLTSAVELWGWVVMRVGNDEGRLSGGWVEIGLLRSCVYTVYTYLSLYNPNLAIARVMCGRDLTITTRTPS